MAVTFPGTGILAGTHDPEEIDRRIEEDRRKASAAAELAAEWDATLDQIEKTITTYVGEELQAEIAAQRASEETQRKSHLSSFLRFRAFCARFSPPLPHLPAAPAAIAGFLTSEMEQGPRHLNRLRAAIAVMHKRVDLPDPTNDPLVRAVIRLAHKSSPPADNPSNGKETDNG